MTTNCLTTATLIVCNLPPKLWNPAFWMNCVAFHPLILCYNSFLANHLMKIIQESVLLSQAAIQTTTTLPALFSPEMYSLTVLQPKVWNQGIDRPCSPPTALGRVILYLPASDPPSIPWFLVASFHSLPPFSQGHLFSSPCFSSSVP